MTTRPELKVGSHLWRGMAAVLLFAVMAATFLGLNLSNPAGFANIEGITASIGYAMFDIPAGNVCREGVSGPCTEPFLVAFEIIDVVLVAALVGAVMLARREEAGEVVEALEEWGGED